MDHRTAGETDILERRYVTFMPYRPPELAASLILRRSIWSQKFVSAILRSQGWVTFNKFGKMPTVIFI